MAYLEDTENFLVELPIPSEIPKDIINIPYIMNISNMSYDEPIYSGPEWYVVPIVFGLIFIVGVLGNGTLILTVLINRNMRSTPNVLLVSLALGDLLLILISVPFSSTYYTFSEWPYGEAVCKLNEFLCALSLGVSVFTLTALSGERYMVIVYPMTGHRGSPLIRTLSIAGSIWILSALLASVELFSVRLVTTHNITVCETYPSDGLLGGDYGKFHSMFRFLIYFAIPISIIACFYIRMSRMLIISSKQMPGDGLKQQGYKQMEARKKVARLVLSFVLVFAVCWLPRHIYSLWYNYDPSVFNMFWNVFKIFGFCLAFINSCINPLALYFLSRQFRSYYDRYLFCWCGPCCHLCCRRRSSPGGGGPRRHGGGEFAPQAVAGISGAGTRECGHLMGGGAHHPSAGGCSPTHLQMYKSSGRTSRKPSPPLTAVTAQTLC